MAFYIELILNSNEKRAATVGKWFYPTIKNAEVDTPHKGPFPYTLVTVVYTTIKLKKSRPLIWFNGGIIFLTF